MVDGVKAPKGSRRGQMLLMRDDGTQVTASWKPVAFGFDLPQLVVAGREYRLVEPLKWHQWVWSALPLVLVFIGGMMGTIVGLIALSINAGLFRSKWNPVFQYVVSGAVSVVAVILYLIAASALVSSVN